MLKLVNKWKIWRKNLSVWLVSKSIIDLCGWILFSLDEQQVKAAAKDVMNLSRDVNLAPITEDDEQPTENTNDDERSNAPRGQDDGEVKN